MRVEATEAFNTSSVIGNYLNIYFGQEQGARLGESSVASLKAHQVVAGRKGTVLIQINRDAGQKYLDFIDPGQVVHLDVFHKPGVVNPRNVAKRIFWAVEQYLLEEDPRLSFLEDEKFKYAVDMAFKIQITTRAGQGTVYDLFQGNVEPIDEEDEGMSHVRVLLKISPEKYGVILPVADAVEEAIISDGLDLVKVRRITHGKEKEQPDVFGNYIIFPWKRLKNANYQVVKENQRQLVMKLAEKFGSVEEVEDFLKSYSNNIIKRTGRDSQKRKYGEVEHYLEQLENLGALKRTWMGPVLTKDGKEILNFVTTNKNELEAEMRRNIRHVPRSSGRYHKIGDSNQKVSTVEYTNRNKVVRLQDNLRSGDLAVPETVIQARKSGLLRHDQHLSIRKEDLHVYSKRTYIPMDVCLLIDASASMAGEKRQAACYLAEHLLLTGREKVSVVTFQEMSAQVSVPFTKNQRVLSRGLRRIRPGGFTPLADGIVTSVELIKSSQVDNPVLILITDGMPNFPLWSLDSKKDALEAAQKIAANKIRFLCIGVNSNKDFLQELADIGKGKLYVADDLNRNNLIDIVKYEKKMNMMS